MYSTEAHAAFRAVNVRVVAATHRDLDEEVKKGNFREDLLYRLRVVPIHMPPLRERPDDIALLARTFVTRYADELSEGPTGLAEATIARLEEHAWPGNVRELENAIKRALVLHTGGVLTPDDFDFLTGLAKDSENSGNPSLEELVASEIAAALDDADPSELYRDLLEAKRFLAQRLPHLLPDEVVCNKLLMTFCRGLIAPDPMRRFPSAEAADLLEEGAAAFHRQLIKGDLASEYDNEIRLWLEELEDL